MSKKVAEEKMDVTGSIRFKSENVCLEMETDLITKIEINSDTEQSIDGDDDHGFLLRENLASWSIRNNISNNAINELLQILRPEINGLPIDARILRNTPREMEKIYIAGGEYTHNEDKDCLTDYANSSLITDINKCVTDAIKKNMEEFQEKNKSMFVRLTQEVLVLRKEVGQLKKILLRNETEERIIPKKPFKEIGEFIAFDDNLISDEENMHQIKAELAKINTLNSSKFVKNCWGCIMSDILAQQFAWRGTDVKKSIKDTNTAMAIKNTFRVKYEKPDEEFVRATKAFFQFAKNRLKQKRIRNEKRKQRKE